MDPALLRERELFKKKALSTPSVIDSHKAKVDTEGFSRSKFNVHSSGSSGSKHYAHSSNGFFNLKSVCLATIDQHMKTRHQRGQTHFLTLEEILDETKLQDIVMNQKQWLGEYLVKNPKIDVQDGKFAYKPKYKLKNKKSLLRLLEKHEQLGLGGVFLDDVEEGLPNSTSVMKALEDQIISVTRPDKKKVLFYNDKHSQFVVDEEFQKLWRSVPVDSLDDEKIEEYLKIQGFSMEEKGRSKVFPGQKRRKKATSQKKRRFNTHNDHLAGVLEDYSEEEIQKGLMRTL